RGRLYLVPVEQIDWVEADGDHVKLHIGPHSYRIRETLGGMERKLDPTRFVRIHRSTIVQLSQIRELQPFFHGDY
ncbi:MAG: LytTR family transcriptional regulator, partial [Gammaproteobacteria bacterium]|nr:LytTR family transcriptional regulator [Gammaproteobacteria bacterium]NIR29376.1 LytTR family transcriptional regulator [Gammaproteobacteria bacterium]NIU04123.1 LytTR family transcriptional regulator [Gammaproteobacteria bacterium]NIV51432.1 LytTR family transcriptional regulator [Gammaproteobacteria bacterium]NIX85397.1 LytTR family transcriptional regulator [Gammaproteobacteria bacterium]